MIGYQIMLIGYDFDCCFNKKRVSLQKKGCTSAIEVNFIALGLHFLCIVKQIYRIMVIVSTRDFRTNQTKYLNLAKAGEHVVLKSRAGSFRIFPDDGGDTIDAPRDLIKELRNALTEVKEAIAGKRKLQSADSLLDEL